MVNCLSAQQPPVTDAVAGSLLLGAERQTLERYLFDESRSAGHADALAFPSSTEDLSRILCLAARKNMPVTVSGARTGIAGGAVPHGGMVVSLERMNRFLELVRQDGDTLILTCEAGVLLSDIYKAAEKGIFSGGFDKHNCPPALRRELRRGSWFFPPDPTETSASIGGMAACNASGAHSFRYGPTRGFVESLTVVLYGGDMLTVRRGQVTADPDGTMILKTADGKEKTFSVPSFARPRTKNAAGYFSGHCLDAVDLFVGSEGTLGVIAEVGIRLIPAPEIRAAQMIFWATEKQAMDFVRHLRGERQALGLEAIEYVGPRALEFLRRRRRQLGPASGVPACLPDAARCGVFVDMGLARSPDPSRTQRQAFPGRPGGTDLSGKVTQLHESLLGALKCLAALVEDLGGSLSDTWSAHANSEREVLRVFRHALPEAVNARIAERRQSYPELTKLGTDMAVPDECLDDIMTLYRRELEDAGLEYVVFGHIGDNHLHVNILPRTPEDYSRGKDIYLQLARRVVAMGGSPAAEHGIGKLKKDFLKLLVGDEGLEQMQAVKQAFDPRAMLSPGNLF